MRGGGTVPPKTMTLYDRHQPSCHNTLASQTDGRILSAVAGPVYINFHPKCELPCSNDFRDKEGVLKLMVGHGPLYHLPGSVILTCSLNMSFLVRRVSDNFRNSEKFLLGHHPPQPPYTGQSSSS